MFNTKAVAKFKAIEEEKEPVVDVNNVVKNVSMNSDTHMKIIISKKVGEMIKKRVAFEEHPTYTSWDSIFLKWLKAKEKRSDDYEEDEGEEYDNTNTNDSNINKENEDDDDVFSYALFGVSMKQIRKQSLQQSTIDRLKKLYKQVCKTEKEYIITPDAFVAELMETYQKTRGFKIEITEYHNQKDNNDKSNHERGFKSGQIPWNKGLHYTTKKGMFD